MGILFFLHVSQGKSGHKVFSIYVRPLVVLYRLFGSSSTHFAHFSLYSAAGYHTDREKIMSQVGFSLMMVLLHPKSTGDITLGSKDPKAYPLIDPHYLEDSHDVKVMNEVSMLG